MTETLTTLPADFYLEEQGGFLKSVNLPALPTVGDTIVMDAKMYTVAKIAWDFDVGGMPLLVRIMVRD